MGINYSSNIKRVNFEDIQYIINNPNNYLLINTLPNDQQDCLIKGTILYNQEEIIINKYIETKQQVNIIIYGKNCNDDNIIKKYNQIITLGFYNVFIYLGSLFEWLMLQDIYGSDNFPTTSKELDILKFKPTKKLNIYLIQNFS